MATQAPDAQLRTERDLVDQAMLKFEASSEDTQELPEQNAENETEQVSDQATDEQKEVESEERTEESTDQTEQTEESTESSEEAVEAIGITDLNQLSDHTGLANNDLMDLQVDIKVDGKETKLALKDVVAGYQKEAHSNEKSMQLAEQQKEATALKERLTQDVDKATQLVETYQTRMNEASELVTALEEGLLQKYKGVDWNTLRSQDPAEYAAQMAEFNATQGQVKQVKDMIATKVTKAHEEDQTAQVTNQTELRKTEMASLLVKKPKFNDERFNKIKSFVTKTYGFNAQEVDGLSDHRLMVLLDDLMELNEGRTAKQSAKSKKVIPKLKVVKTGPPENTKVKQAMQDKKRDQAFLNKKNKTTDDLLDHAFKKHGI